MSVSNDFLEPHYRIPLDEEPPKPLTEKRVVVIAALVALVIGALPALVSLLAVGGNLTQQQTDIKATQAAIIDGRVQSTRTFCDQINNNTRVAAKNSEYLQGLIINGAKASKPFEKIYRDAGQPPYAERVKQAEVLAAGLANLVPRELNCDELVRKVRTERNKQ